MPTNRTRPKHGLPGPSIRKGSQPGGTRRLPRDFDRLAAGEERDRRPQPRGPRPTRVFDERERVLIPGTNNRDARAVYDGRVGALRDAIARDDQATLGLGLLSVLQLRLYRARNVVNFDAFVASVLDLRSDRAQEAVVRAASQTGSLAEPVSDPVAALWIRTEAALREHLGDQAIQLAGSGQAARLELSVPADPVAQSVEALSAVGRQAAGLARHLSGDRGPGRDHGSPQRPKPERAERSDDHYPRRK